MLVLATVAEFVALVLSTFSLETGVLGIIAASYSGAGSLELEGADTVAAENLSPP